MGIWIDASPVVEEVRLGGMWGNEEVVDLPHYGTDVSMSFPSMFSPSVKYRHGV